MALTDYISPDIIAAEGYVHSSDNDALLECIDKDYLHSQGWVDMSAVRDVPISVRKAAEIVGVAASTLAGYVSLGYLKSDDEGHVSLFDALVFDRVAAKKRLLADKPRYVNRRVHRPRPRKPREAEQRDVH